jgi:MOSC domain-containing protein YiiM
MHRLTARLLSVNVGLPRDIEWRGKTVHTAVWKSPVQGPRMVRRLNIDGDGQGDLAGHGGEHRAVFVYQIDSYHYWQSQLGRNDFTYGQFGENFTVDGLSDQEVCIGDRFRVGGALFEVTQPRVTCYRVGIRMNERQMAALLVAHGRPGFYFRVLEEGEVEAGDEIAQVAAGPERMTVFGISALLYMPGHPRSELVRALRIPALSAGWRDSFRALLEQERGPGQLHASRRRRARCFTECRHRGNASAGNAPRVGCRGVAEGSLVALRGPQPPRAPFRRGDSHAPKSFGPRPQPHFLQFALSRGSARIRF